MKNEEIVMNTLISLKHLASFFSTFASESGSKEVAKVVDQAYKEILNVQRKVYTCMVNEAWMKVNYQTKSAIEKEYKKYKNKSCAQ